MRLYIKKKKKASPRNKRIDQDSRLMVYKSINGLAAQYMSNLFTRTSACSSRSLQNTKTDLRIPKKTSANGQKCFSYRGAKLRSSLPAKTNQTPQLLCSNSNSNSIDWGTFQLMAVVAT